MEVYQNDPAPLCWHSVCSAPVSPAPNVGDAGPLSEMMVGASKPTKVIQEPCLNVPKPAARYQKRVGAQKLQTAPPPVTLLRFFSGQPCSPPSVQHHACDPQPFASSPAGRSSLQLVAPAGVPSRTRPSQRPPAPKARGGVTARPEQRERQRQGEGAKQRQALRLPRTPRPEAGDVRRSRTTALRGRQRARKHIRKAAAQAAREGHQETTGEGQSGPAAGGNAASSSQRPAHLPWPPPTPPVPTRDRASSQHEDARDPPVVLRENPDAPPTPDKAYSFETDFSEEEVDEQGIPLADKVVGGGQP